MDMSLRLLVTPPIATALALTLAAPTSAQEIHMNKATPIITVEAIEPCLPFWTDRLGFEITATVPHGDVIGFAMLQKDGVELMYQARASVQADLGAQAVDQPDLADRLAAGMSTLFIEVPAIDPLVDALAGVPVVVPRRQTFYGMDEIFVRVVQGGAS